MRRLLARGVDALLEATVVLSFSRIGYRVRRRLARWTALDSYRLQGRVILVTGATSGIGFATAEQLASCGATVVLLGRDRERTEAARERILQTTGNEAVTTLIADMADTAAVRRAASEFRSRFERLDVLVHNAGALVHTHTLTSSGVEITAAGQLIGPFLMTGLLLDLLVRSAPARVITVASGGMYAVPLSVDALVSGRGPGEEEFRGPKQYARVKRAQVTLNELWSERLPRRDVFFHSMHPGWVDTPGLTEALPRFYRLIRPIVRTPAQGADTIAWLASDDGVPLSSSGRFWLDRRPRATHWLWKRRRREPAEERRRLWDFCMTHSGWSGDVDSVVEVARAVRRARAGSAASFED
ncbi:MAG: SDR family NAD(P)-dependent oxidoreductase [Dehalococcoidia bacterium]